MDEHITLGESLEHRAIRRQWCGAAMHGIVLVRQRQARQFAQRPLVDQALRRIHIAGTGWRIPGGILELQLAQRQLAQRLRHVAGDLQPDGRAVGTTFRPFFDDLHQARGAVLIHAEIRASRDPKRIRPLDDASRVQQAEVRTDHVLNQHELPIASARYAHEPRSRFWHLEIHEMQRSSPIHGAVAHHHRQGETQVGNQRERMPGRAGQRLRCDQREDLIREVTAQRFLLRPTERGPAPNHDTPGGQCRLADIAPATRLPLAQRADANRDRVQHLFHGEPITIGVAAPIDRRAFQGGNAHHEELVQVGAEDGQKADPREQWDRGIFRQRQDPRVEFDQTQVGVQEMLGTWRPYRRERRRPRVVREAPSRRGLRFPARLSPSRLLGQHLGPRHHRQRGERARVPQIG